MRQHIGVVVAVLTLAALLAIGARAQAPAPVSTIWGVQSFTEDGFKVFVYCDTQGGNRIYILKDQNGNASIDVVPRLNTTNTNGCPSARTSAVKP